MAHSAQIVNSTQLNSTGHVTLTAKRDQKKGKKANSLSISLISNIVIHTPFKAVYSVAVNTVMDLTCECL